MKIDFTKWLLEIAIPMAETSSSSFIAQIKEQAVKESGWNKLRDLVILPFVINIGLYITKKTLEKTIEGDIN